MSAELEGLEDIIRMLREVGLEVAYDSPFMSAVGDPKQFIEFAKKLGYSKKDEVSTSIIDADGKANEIIFVKSNGLRSWDIERFKKNVQSLATSCKLGIKGHISKQDYSYDKLIWQITVKGKPENIEVFKNNIPNIDAKIVSGGKK